MIKSQNLNINEKDGVTFVTFPVLEKYGIKHAFSTRLGGVSDGIYSSMNFSFTQGDNPDNVLENYKRICSAIGVDYKRCVLSKQTHTTNIRIVTEEDAGNFHSRIGERIMLTWDTGKFFFADKVISYPIG